MYTVAFVTLCQAKKTIRLSQHALEERKSLQLTRCWSKHAFEPTCTGSPLSTVSSGGKAQQRVLSFGVSCLACLGVNLFSVFLLASSGAPNTFLAYSWHNIPPHFLATYCPAHSLRGIPNSSRHSLRTYSSHRAGQIRTCCSLNIVFLWGSRSPD